MERIAAKAPSKPSVSQLQSRLEIDEEDIDAALLAQPDLYFHVSEYYVEAVAERDAIKLHLEEARAELYEQFRKQALDREEKITEAALQNKLTVAPRIKELERAYLETQTNTNKLSALKESFQQRSFMLRELVARSIARLGNLSLERGITSSRRDLADAVHEATGRMRERRRSES